MPHSFTSHHRHLVSYTWVGYLSCLLTAVSAWNDVRPLQAAEVDNSASNPESRQAAALRLDADYRQVVQPIMRQYCYECHAADTTEAEIDFEQYQVLSELQRHTETWQKVSEMLESGQMPPVDAPQLPAAEQQSLRSWVRSFLTAEAAAHAGDPGPVVLRRLSNAEYTYTMRDLTGLSDLDPAREFPGDGAAGEGFTNAGQALVMSPALIAKYLDAAKEVANHAVLLPGGIRFSPYTSRRDWTNDVLARIRNFYAGFTNQAGGDQVNLQGIVFETNQGGRLPVEAYLRATLEHREALRSGTATIADVARQHHLNANYLETLWNVLTSASSQSFLLEHLRARWQAATPAQSEELADEVGQWQNALWKFNSVGHIGKVGGPRAWLEPITPTATSQELRLTLQRPAAAEGPTNQGPGAASSSSSSSDSATAPARGGTDHQPIRLYLIASSAGDGDRGDDVVWQRPRIVAPGRPELLLRDIRLVTSELASRRAEIFASTASCLEAAGEAGRQDASVDVNEWARRFQVSPSALAAWFDYLGIGSAQGALRLGTPLAGKVESSAGYDFIRGWSGGDALSVVANSSDQHVRIPGNMRPHSVAVHPSPTQSVGVAWLSPLAASVKVQGSIQHAHPECGNGVAWTLELRRGSVRQRLAAGISQGSKVGSLDDLPPIAIQRGDVVALLISPRDGNHSCDLTSIELSLQEVVGGNKKDGNQDGSKDGNNQDAPADSRRWNLAHDVSADILAGNPHADQYGHAAVWHFFSEPVNGQQGHVIPANSLLARWQATDDRVEQQRLAEQLQRTLMSGSEQLPSDEADREADRALYRQLTSLSGPLLSAALQALATGPDDSGSSSTPANATGQLESDTATDFRYGLAAGDFGKHPDGTSLVAADSLCVRAPAVIEVDLPADLVEGAEFVATGLLHPETGREGSVQLLASLTPPRDMSETPQASPTASRISPGPWTGNNRQVSHASPIVVHADSEARRRIEASFDDFRRLFPAALCYTKIVPVDEVVTLTLFYREDEQLQRLMLDESQIATLNELWDELHFVSQDPLRLVDAFEQLWQFATQDADPTAFEPLRAPILARAEAFRRQQLDAEPSHVAAVIGLAEQAFRRPLTTETAEQLRQLYAQLRQQELGHEEAVRLLIARLLVSPQFLYRLETPAAGPGPGPVTDFELASRLSYFLWASPPDSELLSVASRGGLTGQASPTGVDPAFGAAAPPGVADKNTAKAAPASPELLAESQRMLRDARTRRLAIEFFCQWFHIRDFDLSDEKSERHFPTFAAVKGPMYEEAIQFFQDLIQRDQSILSLLQANHTFVNDELARHYGLAGVDGSQWRRVDDLQAQGRGGILTLGAILSTQAGASRTSPILRGNWLSEVVLGEKLPRPPKNVPPLAETAPEGLSERQLIERHSSDPACVKCHQRIDPFGFALENFDAIGRFRREDASGLPIDARTTLPDGTAIEGWSGLRDYLLNQRREAFVRQFNRKLLGYALGRGLLLSDEPLLVEMASQLQAHDYRFSVAVQAIVASPQFQQIRGSDSDRPAGSE